MLLNEFQYFAKRTAIYPKTFVEARDPTDPPVEVNIVYPSLGYAGEAGEFSNKIKKIIRDNHGEISEELRRDLGKELGDGLWYIAACASELGLMLDDIAKDNIAKLNSRAERGVLKGSGDER